MPEAPAYLRIAGDLRERIASGTLAPGDRVPSQNDLATTYGVSPSVAIWALEVLKNEGLVETRRGAGTFVRGSGPLIIRRGYQRNQRIAGAHPAPYERDVEAAGLTPRIEHESEQVPADATTARRLGISPGDRLMYTRLVFYADDIPVQIGHSWERMANIEGTPIELPEESPVSGVVARYDLIGIRIDDVLERLRFRPPHPQEIELLKLPPRGAFVVVFDRTYFAQGRPVEVADMVLVADRYEVEYRIPID